jgi:decaprenylphospho-beta-D-erythro-pentofuranosid-2-ulose 2-reductase
VRVRRSNFAYGGAKAGLDGFCQGLSDALVDTGVEVMIVRPGFVHTKMTAGRTPAPFAVSADEVASAVVRGLERSAGIVWVPSTLVFAFAILQHLPRPLWDCFPDRRFCRAPDHRA